MKLSSEGCDADPQEGSRSKPFEIDLNEAPVCSPREIVASIERSRAGGAAVRLLDINALPPSEEETIEVENFGSNNAPETCSNALYEWNQLNVPKAPGSVTYFAKTGFEDVVQQRMNFGRNLKETDPRSVIRERLWATDTPTQRVSYQNDHGLDGNRFDSMFDVPGHLGLSNYQSLEPQNRSDGFALMQKGLHSNQITKDSLKFSPDKNYKECPESLNSSFVGEFSLGIETKESQAYKLKSNMRVTSANSEANGGSNPLQVGLPVQFEDFCVLAAGEVDPRPSYHSTSQIWPVGYRCSWHDKITGSLFACEVTDGGDFGPLFKVKRYPCCAQPIPIGSTVLLRQSFNSHDGKCQVDTKDTVRLDDDEYTKIQMLISDNSPPLLECNILSDLGNVDEAHTSETKNSTQMKSNCPSHPGRPTTSYIELDDDIGEFLVEDRSSSSVWRMVSQTLVQACHKAYEQTGVCKFCCKHDLLRMWSSCFVSVNEEATENLDSLDKFCCSSGPINIPHLIRNNDELDTSCKALVKWLDQDRFGFDVGFVQEIIEQHPRVYLCAEYVFLNKRSHQSILQTVGSGFLRVTRKGHLHEKEADSSPLRGCKRPREQVVENPVMKSCFPPGKPLSSKLPTELIGDVFQSWELLWRFSEILGLEEPLSFKELEEELIYGHSSTLRSSSSSTVSQENEHACVAMEMESLRGAAHVKQASNTDSGCSGVALGNVLCTLLKILLGELQSKVAAFVDSNCDGGETKSRRRRKKDVDNSMSAKKVMLDMLPINGLTWPELARRYVLTVSSMEGNLDFVDFVNHENGKAFHCLQGDSRTIRGSLPGVAGMEANALLLAEATKQIFGAVKSKNDISNVDYNESDAIVGHKTVKVNDSGIPEWAQVLEPVRKLPTNVGARIRKCVYEALNKHPPEWAKRRLEHSISKEVYKGNASGPTKKAVLSVLADVCGEPQQQKPNRKRKNRCFNSISDVIMKQCRKVLRCAAADDEEKVFCNLLGRTLHNTSDNDDEGLLGFPAMVSRPLDFRTIDLRLAFGAYSGSHEAFLEDVREVWHHIRTAYSDQSDLLQLAEKFSRDFEDLYEKEVVSLVQKFSNYPNIDSLNSEAKKEIEDIFESASEIPKAPWDEGVCKVCGIDKDDDNVLLCDTCDSGYHTYCLTPPLARVPEGNWYCPSCVTGHCNSQYTSQVPQVISRSQKRRYHGEFSHGFMESLSHLTTTMEMRDYWEYTARERIFLVKFLCDELLNSADVREHLEQCASVSADLQQKLRLLYLEWRNLKFTEETITGKVARVNSSVFGGAGKSGPEGAASVRTNNRKSMRQPPRGSSHFSLLPSDLVLPEDRLQWLGENVARKQPYWLYSKGHSMRHPCYSGNQVGGAPSTNFQLHPQYDKDNSLKIDKPPNELPLSAPQTQKHENAGELFDWSNLNREQEIQKGGNNGSVLPSCEVPQSHISPDSVRSHVAEHICAKHVNCENQVPVHRSIVQPDTNESQARDVGIELKNLQDSIACLESQLLAVSLRKEPLGRDSAGRLYWAFSRPGTSPWLVVDGTMLLQQGNVTKENKGPLANNSTLKYSPFETGNKGIPTSSSWFSYQSDAEIEELVEWLTDSDVKERELAESILRWRRIGYKDSNKAGNFVQDEILPSPSNRVNSGTTVNPNGIITNALVALEKKHGPCLELKASKNPMRQCENAELTCTERMYRCECLEPVWPSRCHCCWCHQSFLSSQELKEHNDGICNLHATASQESKANDSVAKEKGLTGTEKLLGECVSGRVKHETGLGLSEFSKESASPYEIEEISAKFVTESSIKELVQEIGLIGSNGIPSFVPDASLHLSDPAFKLVSLCRNDVNQSDESPDLENHLKCPIQGNKNSCVKHDSISNNSIGRRIASGNDEEMVKFRSLNPIFLNEKRDQSLYFRSPKLVGNDDSLRPLMGRSIQILRQLKINLLDMDAAVPEEALRSSKACWGKRCAWRAYVKSAKSISEMVQATIILEDMIRTEYLRNGWWYWSSLSAAASIATIASLALRMYTLDGAIIYERPSAIAGSTETQEHGCKSENDILPCEDSANGTEPRKPVAETPSSDPTDLSKQRSKSSKRRKDLVR
ncbi:hypothetical protein ACOSQ2_018634 [Xanthoceras sorbifolium]